MQNDLPLTYKSFKTFGVHFFAYSSWTRKFGFKWFYLILLIIHLLNQYLLLKFLFTYSCL